MLLTGQTGFVALNVISMPEEHFVVSAPRRDELNHSYAVSVRASLIDYPVKIILQILKRFGTK